MPGPILHLGATVVCMHGGQATPTATVPRVLVSGQTVASIVAPYGVVGCAFVPPGGNGPCATGQWTAGATRVFTLGQPVVIATGMSTCIPTATPLVPMAYQLRVVAT